MNFRCLFFLLAIIPVVASAVPRFVYTANYFGDSISIYRVDASTGMLHHQSHVPTIKGPSTVILHPSGKYLYTISQVTDDIVIYRVNAKTGALTEIENSPVSAGVRSAFQLEISPDGKFLYVPGRFTQNLMVHKINQSSGALTRLRENNFPTQGERARFIEVTPDGQFIYVSNTVSDTIAAFKMDSVNESVSSIAGMPFKTGDAPQASMVHPSGKYLYVANWRSANISAYKINANSGVLAPIPGQKVETELFPINGSVHPSGKFLYVANWATSDVSGFVVNQSTGSLSPMPGMPVKSGGGSPVTVVLDKSGRYAYVPNYGGSNMTVFDINGDSGLLVNPRQMMTRPGVRQLVILEGESPVKISTRWMIATDKANKTISNFAINAATGKLQLRHKLQLDSMPSEIALHSDAGLIFVAYEKDSRIDVFSLDNNGKIHKQAKSSVQLDGIPRDLRVNARGSHLYAITQAPNQYLAFDIDVKNRQLKKADRIVLPADSKPVQISASPEERLTFVLDGSGNRIFAYRYLQAAGPVIFELNRRGSPFAMGNEPSDFVLDPTGQYGLVINSGDATLGVYKMPGAWAAIKEVEGSPVKVGKRPVSVAVNPNGHFVYVVDADAGLVHQFKFDVSNGTLKPILKPVSVGKLAGASPQELLIDPSGNFAYLRYIGREGLTRFKIDASTGRLINSVEMLDKATISSLAFTTVTH